MIKRRKFTPEFKAQVALEVISGAKSAAEAGCGCSIPIVSHNSTGQGW